MFSSLFRHISLALKWRRRLGRLRQKDLGWLLQSMLRKKTKALRVLEELVRALKDLLLPPGFLLQLAQRVRGDPAQWIVAFQV